MFTGQEAAPRLVVHPTLPLIVGVDAHTDTFTAALLMPTLQVIQTITLPNTEAGYLDLLSTCVAARLVPDSPRVRRLRLAAGSGRRTASAARPRQE